MAKNIVMDAADRELEFMVRKLLQYVHPNPDAVLADIRMLTSRSKQGYYYFLDNARYFLKQGMEIDQRFWYLLSNRFGGWDESMPVRRQWYFAMSWVEDWVEEGPMGKIQKIKKIS